MAYAGVPKLTIGVISRKVLVRKFSKPVLKASPVKCGFRYYQNYTERSLDTWICSCEQVGALSFAELDVAVRCSLADWLGQFVFSQYAFQCMFTGQEDSRSRSIFTFGLSDLLNRKSIFFFFVQYYPITFERSSPGSAIIFSEWLSV